MCFTYGAARDGWGVVISDTAIQLRDDNGIEIEGMEGRYRVEPFGGRVVYDGHSFTAITGTVKHWFSALDRHAETGLPLRLEPSDSGRTSAFVSVLDRGGHVALRVDRSDMGTEELRCAFSSAPPQMDPADLEKIRKPFQEIHAQCRTPGDHIRAVAWFLDACNVLSNTVTDDMDIGLVVSEGQPVPAGAYFLHGKARGARCLDDAALWSLFQPVGPTHAIETRDRIYPEFDRLSTERELAHAEFNNGFFRGELQVGDGDLGGWTITSTELNSGSVKIQADAERILMGSATAPTSGTGIFLGKDGSDYEFRAGNPAGDHIHWDGSGLSISGTLEAGSEVAASSFTASSADFDGNVRVGPTQNCEIQGTSIAFGSDATFGSASGDAQIVAGTGSVVFSQNSTPTVTGSRGGNAALASLLSALDSMGLISDSST